MTNAPGPFARKSDEAMPRATSISGARRGPDGRPDMASGPYSESPVANFGTKPDATGTRASIMTEPLSKPEGEKT